MEGQPKKSSGLEKWIQAGLFLLLAAMGFFLGVYEYFYLSHIENSGGDPRLNVLFGLLYAIGGKGLVAAFSILTGVIFTVAGFLKILRG